jgi:hypothetical protein
VTGRGLELSRIDLLGELEKGARILPEVVDVKHRLQTHQDTLHWLIEHGTQAKSFWKHLPANTGGHIDRLYTLNTS